MCTAAMPAAARSLAQDVCCFCHRPGDPRVPGELAVLLSAPQAPPRPTLAFHEACAGYSSAVAWGRKVGKERMPYGAGEVRQAAAREGIPGMLPLPHFQPHLETRRGFSQCSWPPPVLPPDPGQAGAHRVDEGRTPAVRHLRQAGRHRLLQGRARGAAAAGARAGLQGWQRACSCATAGGIGWWLTLHCQHDCCPHIPAVRCVLAPAMRPPGSAGWRGRAVLGNHARGGLQRARRQVGCRAHGCW